MKEANIEYSVREKEVNPHSGKEFSGIDFNFMQTITRSFGYIIHA